jgi:uncharacterized membrane protein
MFSSRKEEYWERQERKRYKRRRMTFFVSLIALIGFIFLAIKTSFLLAGVALIAAIAVGASSTGSKDE